MILNALSRVTQNKNTNCMCKQTLNLCYKINYYCHLKRTWCGLLILQRISTE